jgi:hypothetical protein
MKDMNIKLLGERLYLSAFMVKSKPIGSLDVGLLNARICKVTSMNTGGIRPSVYRFPTPGGKGGVGFTHIQPIVESFIVTDWWDDHGHFFYVFGSCKSYEFSWVKRTLEDSGLEILSEKFTVLEDRVEPRQSLLKRFWMRFKVWIWLHVSILFIR